MESDVTTGTESDFSDWDPANAQLTSENEDSDDYAVYYGDMQMYDTAIGGNNDRFSSGRPYSGPNVADRHSTTQMRKIISQLNSSQNDSAYSGSGSLYPIHESSSDHTGSEQEEEMETSPRGRDIPVYGRYQKLPSQAAVDEDALSLSGGLVEHLMLHRLPGENLGMILGIEECRDGTETVYSVLVKSVTLGGAAYRATGSSKGVCVGDKVVEVNGLDLRTLSHDECVQVFKDMPLRVSLGILRGQKDLPPVSVSPAPIMENKDITKPARSATRSPMQQGSRPVQITRRREASDSEEDGFGGFAMYHVTVKKETEQNLGISIVPSYGSTREYYQIKRILPSGAAAQSGRLEVGDRLISCNGTSLCGLTQNHCLDIIKSASSCGDITFEVIRPVYHGNSMEISVTVNNGVHSRTLDPSQYSLKAQSYDRQGIDVVVTSESEDYLTVSEDEYSKSGRLANIPETEANEVFVSNSVRLAFQTPVNTIEEESTETDTDSFIQESVQQNKPLETIEINSSIPYIPPAPNTATLPSFDETESVDLPIYHLKPVTNPTYISSDSERDQEVPPLNIPNSDLDQVSPRSPLPTSQVDDISPRAAIPASNLDQISSSPLLNRKSDSKATSILPASDLDDIYLKTSYTKRQQVPSDSELSVPYNYPPGYVDKEIPVSDTEATRYNPLYDDSNQSEFTDSDTQDIYIASPFHSRLGAVPSCDLDRISLGSNRTITRTDLDAISVGSDWKIEASQNETDTDEISVPPPVEFSDNNSFDQQTNPEPVNSKTDSDTSESDLDEAKLAFNNELTAPFDIVLQEQGIDEPSYQLNGNSDSFENNVVQDITQCDDGTFVISQFEAKESEKVESKNYIVTRFAPTVHKKETKMDNNSEAMLKDALDMEYEYMSESNKFEARIKLGNNNNNNNIPNMDNGFDDPMFENQNVVAENIAKDITKFENGNVGYYVESDDEPDKFPEADAPEELPELPDAPPPPLFSNGEADVIGTVMDSSVDTAENPEGEIVMDSNWSLKAKPAKHELDNDIDSEEIVPVKIQRKVEIPIKFGQTEEKVEHDDLVPESIKRVFQLPEHFQERSPSPRLSTKIELDDFTFFESVTPENNDKKLVTNFQIENDNCNDIEVEEEPIKPQEVKSDRTRNLVNVISVVNALKAMAKDKDPDEVDRIEKEDVTNKKNGSFVSAVLSIGGKTKEKQISPPKEEQVVSAREEITVSSVTKPQFVSNVDVKTGANEPEIKRDSVNLEKNNLQTSTEKSVKDNVPVMKTSITVKKTDTKVNSGAKDITPVPPLNLDILAADSLDQNSPKSDHSGSHSPTTYKTTIGVSKQESLPKTVETKKITETKTLEKDKTTAKPEKPVLATVPLSKPLSQIKPLSFNPKSLSQTGSRSVQYKTTISALGMKPGGLSKPLAGSVKPDHPIKRMETMPFEVSILKGILGIGIKTTMTPEGYVKVAEILQNGPVGREGNIKVGDYLLSINNTQLTGLTDGKVQQILRLLPRGLSKIVASAVPPGEVSEQLEAKVEKPQLASRQSLPPSTVVKPQLSPRQSSPLTSPRQQNTASVSVTQKPLSPPQKPAAAPRAGTIPHTQPALPKSQPPVIAPRSLPVTSQKSPTPAKRTPPAVAPKPLSPRSHVLQSSSSAEYFSPSPSAVQQQHSVRSPPPVAPKPKRTKEQPVTPKEDLNEPIETEIFVSINSRNETSPGSANVLPGSTTYDSVLANGKEKTDWIPGLVSSSDIKKGKNDIVSDTDAQTVNVDHKTDTYVDVLSTAQSNNDILNTNIHVPCSEEQQSEYSVQDKEEKIEETNQNTKHHDENNLIQLEDVIEQVNAKKEEAVQKLTDLEKDLNESQTEAEGALLNRSRTFSTSSNASSYTEFKECDVEDEMIPEQINEEEESLRTTADIKEEGNGDEDKYESDFEEDQEEMNTEEKAKLKVLAETIVSNVMSSIKASDLIDEKSSPQEEQIVETKPEETSTPPLPQSPPPLIDVSCPVKDPDVAPPLPDTQVPEYDTAPATVVDMALYPDSDEPSIEDCQAKEQVDVVDAPLVVNELHAEPPVDCVSHTYNDKTEPSIQQVGETTTGNNIMPNESLKSDDSKNVESSTNDNEDQSVSNVISMYSNLENSWANKNGIKEETNNNEYKVFNESDGVLIEIRTQESVLEAETCDSVRSVAGSDDYRNIEFTDVESNATDNVTDPDIDESYKADIINTNDSSVNGDIEQSNGNDSFNGTSADTNSEPKQAIRDVTDKISTRPKSVSRVDEILSQAAEIERGKYSPEIDRMIRMLSTDNEPKQEGEGEVIHITLNKGVTGLGFLIQGGRSTPKGDMPLTIKKIFKGGPADGILQLRDEICEVNGEDMSDMRHSEAWNHLKFLPSGDLIMKIRRFNTDSTEA